MLDFSGKIYFSLFQCLCVQRGAREALLGYDKQSLGQVGAGSLRAILTQNSIPEQQEGVKFSDFKHKGKEIAFLAH